MHYNIFPVNEFKGITKLINVDKHHKQRNSSKTLRRVKITNTNLHNHLSTSLLPLALLGPFLHLKQNSVTSCAILQRKVTDYFAKYFNNNLFCYSLWIPKKEQKLLEPVIITVQVS
jgi:hypothetical protein